MACELYFVEFPEMMQQQRMATVIQRLMGGAQEWVWRSGGALTSDYSAFLSEFKRFLIMLIRASPVLRSYSISIKAIRQWRTIPYNSAFLPATGTNWPCITLFREGMNAEIQLELAWKDADLDLNKSISLAIKLDQHLRGKVCCRECGTEVGIPPLTP